MSGGRPARPAENLIKHQRKPIRLHVPCGVDSRRRLQTQNTCFSAPPERGTPRLRRMKVFQQVLAPPGKAWRDGREAAKPLRRFQP